MEQPKSATKMGRQSAVDGEWSSSVSASLELARLSVRLSVRLSIQVCSDGARTATSSQQATSPEKKSVGQSMIPSVDSISAEFSEDLREIKEGERASK